MMKHQIEVVCAVSILLVLSPYTAAFEVFPAWTTGNVQESPDVDNGIIVWAELVEGDWDVYGLDLLNPFAPQPIYVAAYIGSDQREPAIWNDRVVYQDSYYGDWDVWVSDISDANFPANYLMTRNEADYIDDQINPVIHGNTAAWQSYVVVDDGLGGTVEDWDIYAADITDPNNTSVYVVDDMTYNQTMPNVYRSTVVYQDDFYVDWDIYAADVWLKNAPQYQTVISDDAGLNQTSPAVWGDIVVYEHETAGGDDDVYSRDMSQGDSEPFLIAGGTGLQQAPDISGHLVVWQDSRGGDFDIYGYNLITREEFQITTDSADQTNPVISGSLVAWEDSRVTPATIYYTWLEGTVIANCPNRLTGDINGDCRVDLTDYAMVAQEWLTCALNPIDACTNQSIPNE